MMMDREFFVLRISSSLIDVSTLDSPCFQAVLNLLIQDQLIQLLRFVLFWTIGAELISSVACTFLHLARSVICCFPTTRLTKVIRDQMVDLLVDQVLNRKVCKFLPH